MNYIDEFSHGKKPGVVMVPRIRHFFCKACKQEVVTTSAMQKYCQSQACLAVRDSAKRSHQAKNKKR